MPEKKQKRGLTLKEHWGVTAVLVLGIVVLIAANICLFISAGSTVVSSARDSFQQTLEEQRQETYQRFYQTSFNRAERKNHVSNHVTIMVDGLREEAQLEVLQVSDVEYVYNKGNTKTWTAIRGHGVYTVDLTLSEFLVDNERKYVLVRVPHPKLSMAGLDYEYENYLFERGVFNGCTSDGVDLAREDLNRAYNQLQTKISSTQLYLENAENAAKMLIMNLVKNLNTDIPDIIVEVEFVD